MALFTSWSFQRSLSRRLWFAKTPIPHPICCWSRKDCRGETLKESTNRKLAVISQSGTFHFFFPLSLSLSLSLSHSLSLSLTLTLFLSFIFLLYFFCTSFSHLSTASDLINNLTDVCSGPPYVTWYPRLLWRLVCVCVCVCEEVLADICQEDFSSVWGQISYSSTHRLGFYWLQYVYIIPNTWNDGQMIEAYVWVWLNAIENSFLRTVGKTTKLTWWQPHPTTYSLTHTHTYTLMHSQRHAHAVTHTHSAMHTNTHS